MILSFFFILSDTLYAQEEKKEEKKEEEKVEPSAPDEAGAFDKGFQKEMPDEGGLIASPELLLGLYTAKSAKKETAFEKAVVGAKSELAVQLKDKLDGYQAALKKEKLPDSKSIFELFAQASDSAKKELLQKPEIIDSSFAQLPDGWEASVIMEVKVADLEKKLVDLTKDKPALAKTKLFKEMAAATAIKEEK